jgi:hypothetical protein
MVAKKSPPTPTPLVLRLPASGRGRGGGTYRARKSPADALPYSIDGAAGLTSREARAYLNASGESLSSASTMTMRTCVDP